MIFVLLAEKYLHLELEPHSLKLSTVEHKCLTDKRSPKPLSALALRKKTDSLGEDLFWSQCKIVTIGRTILTREKRHLVFLLCFFRKFIS